MEDSWENWISSLEMGEDNNSNGQSHTNSLDRDKLLTGIDLEPPDFSFHQSDHHHHHTYTMSYNHHHSNNNDFPTTSTMGSSSLSYDEDASFDERHGKMLKCNSSNSINISQDVANSHIPSSSSAPSKSTFILSFENSTVEPALHDRVPNYYNNSPNKHFEATCSSLLSSEITLISSDHVITKPKAKQGAKKYRTSSEIKDHIMAERKRRQDLTERFIALSATIPGLKKERVKVLENENKRKTTYSKIFIKKSQVCSREEATSSCETNSNYRSTPPPLPQVEARMLEKEVLIGIHCQKQKDIVLKIMALLQNLHLSLASSSVLPFGTSTVKVTIIAQMGDKYGMTVNDLVKRLRQDLLKSHDIQESHSKECQI
ncbi:hypothetical protein GLYMA_03G105000v4 [Glycine max]|uniref:Plant bHLH transcription factor ACT-like domain-containing protein n=2 Tax=Glycine subgen. Soja TaxID=1462606 RepID=A0A0R0KP36_SOYBN|nr:transcription factor bHLH18 isoform X2 [Glycine max]XP_028224969.1 transcription factor bHLH18-like isoform X2 [Glycine soja]KAG4393514.1 hypothetical protein GLYMA_03G105000v4 [Glycine max]KRH66408.1 hypothetical protein GLYMA_03G105000v4 [Glycine max]RZC20040.1 Transcription factor bHLH25 isoform B [Glycine soja]|eukprot:XP_006576686.1 transcription factor bHLH18 isoform X2 [Glycine max]